MKKKNFFKCICIHKSPSVKELDYSSKYLRQVPQDIFNHERTLESLNLDNNNISELTKELFCCRSLRCLILSDNELCSIPNAIGNLNDLVILDVSKNNLQALPDNLELCSRLESLDASGNAYEELPEGLCRLTMLQELMVNTSFLSALPKDIGKLVNLRYLEARENEIKHLPKNLGALTNLQHLDVGNNELTELPDSLCGLTNLVSLSVDKNHLQILPENIGNCQSLQTVEIQNNELRILPDSITNCKALTELISSNNRLRSIPSLIGRLVLLSNLRLDNNKIKRLPDSIGSLESLSQLYISGNELSTLPPSIGLLRKLRNLHADANNITELPTEIGSCSALSILSLRGNRIQYLPDEIGRIPHLKMINLSNNRVKFLPMSFLKLRDLMAVWLNDNQITPLVHLQSERDVDTGTKCLVCYLLPQMSNTDDPDVVENDPSAWKFVQESRPRVVQWNDEHIVASADESGVQNPETASQLSSKSKLPKDAPAKQTNSKHTLTPKHYHHNQQPQHSQPLQNNHASPSHPHLQQQQQPQMTSMNGVGPQPINNHVQYPIMNDQQQQQQFLWNNGGVFLQPQPNQFSPTPQLPNQIRSQQPQSQPIQRSVMFASGYESDSAAAVRYNRNYPVIRGRMDQIREEPMIQHQQQGFMGSGQFNPSMPAASMTPMGAGYLPPQPFPGHHHVPTHQFMGQGHKSGMLVGGMRQSGYSTDTGPLLNGQNRKLAAAAAHHRGHRNHANTAANNAAAGHFRNPYDQLRVMRARELPPSRRIKSNFVTMTPNGPMTSRPLVNTTSTTNSGNSTSTTTNSNMALSADLTLPPPPNRHPPPPPPSRPLPAAPSVSNTGLHIDRDTGTSIPNCNGNLSNGVNVGMGSIPPPPSRTPPLVIDNPNHPGLTSISPSILSDDHVGMTANHNAQMNFPMISQHQQQLMMQQQQTQPSNISNNYTQMRVTIYRDHGLGFSITGGLSSNPNPFRPTDKGIFIAKVNPCGPADGKLEVGDKIMSVNSYNFSGIEHAAAVSVLKSCGDTVQMIIER